ncbi:MAG: cation diffusion facilitator family transporter [Deltaproteobacteria bacterium]|jgi:cation diffusion facilitator family transporter
MRSWSPTRKAALAAFLISILLLAGKFVAYFLTGSVAVWSDAMESIINVTTGAFMVLSVTISSRPADESHPYGHGKIEAFSAGLEGGLILLAAVMILFEALPRFFEPMAPQHLGLGTILLFAAGIINLILGLGLLRYGRQYRSEALVADGRHLLTDFYTSAGVVLGLLAVRWTGRLWLDPLVACLVAIQILIPGLKLVRQAIRNLMNEADPETLQRVVDALNKMQSPVWLCPHDLRVIRSGDYHHIDLHLTLPRYWQLSQAHDVEKEVAATLLSTIGTAGDVMIHLDPCDSACCRCCRLTSCPERQAPFAGSEPLRMENIAAPQPPNLR